MKEYLYPFTEEESEAAWKEWNCNCGPAALAFALQVNLDAVRGSIPGFEEKGYTSPTMMKQALANLGRQCRERPTGEPHLFCPEIALVRVQWTGPWTAKDANPKWAYRATHWICCWRERDFGSLVFDINGGISSFARWRLDIVPAIVASIKRADGGWYATHVWEVVG